MTSLVPSLSRNNTNVITHSAARKKEQPGLLHKLKAKLVSWPIAHFIRYLIVEKKFSLVQQYIFFSIVASLCTIVMSIWITFSTYNILKADEESLLEKEALRLNFELHQHLALIENGLLILTDKFLYDDNLSVEKIISTISRKGHGFHHEVSSFGILSFVDPQGDIRYTSTQGILMPPEHYGDDSSGWRRTAKHLPFKLQFSAPIRDIEGGKIILPSAMGISNKRGEFLGYISLDIDISRLGHSLNRSIGHGTDFIMLDDDLNLVATSDEDLGSSIASLPIGSIREVTHSKYIDPKPLAYTAKIGKNGYTHYICSERYPFIFLIGCNNLANSINLWQHISGQLTQSLMFCVLFLIVILMLGYQVGKPLIQLSGIAKGLPDSKRLRMHPYRIKELDHLAQQLLSIYQVQRTLKTQQQSLTKLNSELYSANELIRNNMSFLSHELKNPACSIIGFSKLVGEQLQPGDTLIKEYISYIHDAAIYQNQQIDFFLDFCRFQDKGRQMKARPLDLAKLIQTNINMIQHHLISNEINVHINIPNNMPKLIGDEIMVSQMIQNLAANGAKYNKRGGTLQISTLILQRDNNRSELQIIFKDTGIGIAHADLKEIFSKFQRIKNENTKDICGYGIGLSYVQNCVILHDGEIRVKSQPGVGTEFTLAFPDYRIHQEETLSDFC